MDGCITGMHTLAIRVRKPRHYDTRLASRLATTWHSQCKWMSAQKKYTNECHPHNTTIYSTCTINTPILTVHLPRPLSYPTFPPLNLTLYLFHSHCILEPFALGLIVVVTRISFPLWSQCIVPEPCILRQSGLRDGISFQSIYWKWRGDGIELVVDSLVELGRRDVIVAKYILNKTYVPQSRD